MPLFGGLHGPSWGSTLHRGHMPQGSLCRGRYQGRPIPRPKVEFAVDPQQSCEALTQHPGAQLLPQGPAKQVASIAYRVQLGLVPPSVAGEYNSPTRTQWERMVWDTLARDPAIHAATQGSHMQHPGTPHTYISFTLQQHQPEALRLGAVWEREGLEVLGTRLRVESLPQRRPANTVKVLLRGVPEEYNLVGITQVFLTCAGYTPQQAPVLQEFFGALVINEVAVPGQARTDTVVAYVKAPPEDQLLSKLPDHHVFFGQEKVVFLVEGRKGASWAPLLPVEAQEARAPTTPSGAHLGPPPPPPRPAGATPTQGSAPGPEPGPNRGMCGQGGTSRVAQGSLLAQPSSPMQVDGALGSGAPAPQQVQQQQQQQPGPVGPAPMHSHTMEPRLGAVETSPGANKRGRTTSGQPSQAAEGTSPPSTTRSGSVFRGPAPLAGELHAPSGSQGPAGSGVAPMQVDPDPGPSSSQGLSPGQGKGRGRGSKGKRKGSSAPPLLVPGMPGPDEVHDRGGSPPLPEWVMAMKAFQSVERQFALWSAHSTFAVTFRMALQDLVDDDQAALAVFFEDCSSAILKSEEQQLNPTTSSDLPAYALAWLDKQCGQASYESGVLWRDPPPEQQQQQQLRQPPLGPRSGVGGEAPPTATGRRLSTGRVSRAPDPDRMYGGCNTMASSPRLRGAAG